MFKSRAGIKPLAHVLMMGEIGVDKWTSRVLRNMTTHFLKHIPTNIICTHKLYFIQTVIEVIGRYTVRFTVTINELLISAELTMWKRRANLCAAMVK